MGDGLSGYLSPARLLPPPECSCRHPHFISAAPTEAGPAPPPGACCPSCLWVVVTEVNVGLTCCYQQELGGPRPMGGEAGFLLWPPQGPCWVHLEPRCLGSHPSAAPYAVISTSVCRWLASAPVSRAVREELVTGSLGAWGLGGAQLSAVWLLPGAPVHTRAGVALLQAQALCFAQGKKPGQQRAGGHL